MRQPHFFMRVQAVQIYIGLVCRIKKLPLQNLLAAVSKLV